MRVGILEAGAPPADLRPAFGRYDAMFARLLGSGFAGKAYDVQAGELPANPEEQDAYVVTGSAAGVYEEHDWIPPLKDFLRAAKGKAKLVGICFGHQVMAEAFGGLVAKFERGWCVGLHRYEVIERAPWMDNVASFAIPVSHQDQIVGLPPAAHVLAGSEFTRFGLIAYDDQPAISFQCHPEFEPAYAAALIETRRARLADADAALASFAGADDRPMVAEWIRRFLLGEAVPA